MPSDVEATLAVTDTLPPGFHRADGRLMVEAVPLSEIADAYGTPCYVYSAARLVANWRAYDDAFGRRAHRIHYAVKANGNLALLRILHELGSGFDIVSGGELARVLAAGARGEDVVFSGVGKRQSELQDALAARVACINVESAAELDRLEEVARGLRCRAPVAFRVNPDVDAGTHPYISTGLEQNKFGVPMDEAPALYRRAATSPWLAVRGIACHIGSQLTDLGPVADSLQRVLMLAERLAQEGIPVQHLDLGGGLGIRYRDEVPPSHARYVELLCNAPDRYELHIEPGRSVVGDAGVLLSTIEYLKRTPARHFAICDAAMTELIRPALYEAWHAVELLEPPASSGQRASFDFVGPVCESADFLAEAREFTLSAGARVAFMQAGAYASAMGSNYNARPRPPEILVDGTRVSEIRRAERSDELMMLERMPDQKMRTD